MAMVGEVINIVNEVMGMVREVMDEAGEVMDMANYRRQGISFISMVAESFGETHCSIGDCINIYISVWSSLNIQTFTFPNWTEMCV